MFFVVVVDVCVVGVGVGVVVVVALSMLSLSSLLCCRCRCVLVWLFRFWLSRLCVCLCCVVCVCVCVSVCVVSVCVGVVCLSLEVHGPRGPEWHFIAGATLVEAAYLAWEESHTNENVKLAMSSGLEDVYFLGERSPDDVLKNLQHVAKSLNLVGSAMPFEKVMVVSEIESAWQGREGLRLQHRQGHPSSGAWRASLLRLASRDASSRRRTRTAATKAARTNGLVREARQGSRQYTWRLSAHTSRTPSATIALTSRRKPAIDLRKT